MNNLTREEKMKKCVDFFDRLSELLGDRYERISSCNADCSEYLVPLGTSGDITYYGKPDNSFRVSDHWSWFANIKKCSRWNYIQCLSVDLPWVRKRTNDKATKPKLAAQVAMIGDDGKYHAVYGEIFDRKTKTWLWLDTDPKVIADLI